MAMDSPSPLPSVLSSLSHMPMPCTLEFNVMVVDTPSTPEPPCSSSLSPLVVLRAWVPYPRYTWDAVTVASLGLGTVPSILGPPFPLYLCRIAPLSWSLWVDLDNGTPLTNLSPTRQPSMTFGFILGFQLRRRSALLPRWLPWCLPPISLWLPPLYLPPPLSPPPSIPNFSQPIAPSGAGTPLWCWSTAPPACTLAPPGKHCSQWFSPMAPIQTAMGQLELCRGACPAFTMRHQYRVFQWDSSSLVHFPPPANLCSVSIGDLSPPIGQC